MSDHKFEKEPNYSGYVKGCRCDDCRKAMRDYQRERLKRKASPIEARRYRLIEETLLTSGVLLPGAPSASQDAFVNGLISIILGRRDNEL